MTRALLFDWGNTIMVDFDLPGPMCNWDRVAWVKGAESALKQIDGNIPCYIATNAPQSDGEQVRKALERIGADRFFEKIFSSYDIGFEKPDKRFFQQILKELSLAPDCVVMIGDNYIKDIEGAKAAGIRTIFFNVGGKEGKYPSADTEIRGMEQLPAAISRLK